MGKEIAGNRGIFLAPFEGRGGAFRADRGCCMREVKTQSSREIVDDMNDEFRCDSDGDSTQCEVDAMVQMGDVYVLMVAEIDDESEGPEKDDLWPFIR